VKAAALAILAGCALTSRSTPRELRYFTPVSNTAVTASTATAPGTPLRLGRIVPSSLLRARIVHRESAVELVPYETLRWSDPPETYARRALAHALFDSREFDEVVGGSNVPVLDVDVLAFEEDRRGDRRFGRVALGYELRDEHRVLAHGVVEVEREARSPKIDAVVGAIGDALSAASGELARRLAAVHSP
jgi:ABC-type uncharacterized transport system auxiliary subunit